MNSELSLSVSSDSTFFFPCPSCHHVIDTSRAQWCRCLVKRPSVVCGDCKVCLCKAEPHFSREFWLRAPSGIVTRNAEERTSRATRPTRSVRELDVMVVDDDEEIRSVAAFMLEQMGYSVMTASCAAEALEMMEQVTPALVLTDALMPRIDGRQLCRCIKAGYPGVRVVIMTSLYTSVRYKNEALKIFRADDYLSKPFDFQKLQDVVGRFVSSRTKAVS